MGKNDNTHPTPDASDDEFPVRQYGPWRLRDEVEAAHAWWVQRGKPGADRWQVMITLEGQRIELDRP